jgi:tetratricopeptide (TPR) repeat protein
MKEFATAHQLDPFSASINYTAAWPLYWAHRTDEAIEQLQKAVELHPNFWSAHYYVGLAYAQRGDLYDALASLWKAQELSETSWLLEGLGYCYALAKRNADVENVLNRLDETSARDYVSPYSYAVIHAGLGNTDQVMKWLEAAVSDRSWRMAWLGVDPFFDSVRADPRFQRILTSIVRTDT